jgi:hypothetical protein
LVLTSVFPRSGRRLLHPLLRSGKLVWLDQDGREADARLAAWRLRNAPVHRLTSEADVFWQVRVVPFLNGIPVMEAHFAAAVASGLEDSVKLWVSVLGDEGLCGRRSAGAGGFEVEDVVPGPVPAFGGVLLSVAVPDGTGGFNPAVAPWVRREGYSDGRPFSCGDLRKAGIRALPEGVRVSPGFRGRVLELDGRRVLYCGLAFCAPL